MLAAFIGQVCGLALALLHSQCCVPKSIVLYVLHRRPDVLHRRPDVLHRRPDVLCRRLDVLYKAELGAENSLTVLLKDTSLMSIGPEP